MTQIKTAADRGSTPLGSTTLLRKKYTMRFTKYRSKSINEGPGQFFALTIPMVIFTIGIWGQMYKDEFGTTGLKRLADRWLKWKDNNYIRNLKFKVDKLDEETKQEIMEIIADNEDIQQEIYWYMKDASDPEPKDGYARMSLNKQEERINVRIEQEMAKRKALPVTESYLKRLMRETIEQQTYKPTKSTTKELLDYEFPEDVEAMEDVWAGGHNIHSQEDWVDMKYSRGVETLKITEAQLKRIIRRVLREGKSWVSIEDFLAEVIWPCYQEGYTAEECYKQSLGAEAMRYLRTNAYKIRYVNDNPEFLAFAEEVASLV